MTDDEIIDALHGIYAYDQGSIDSGIHDEVLRKRLIVWLTTRDPARPHHLTSTDVERVLRRMIREDVAEDSEYGVEDVFRFLQWLRDEMDLPL